MKNYSKQIDDYLMGKLSPVEHEEFELELKRNPALQNKLEFCKDLHDSINEKDIHSLRDKLILAESDAKSHKLKLIKVYSILSAASVAIFIAVRFLFLSPSLTPEELFWKNFEPFKIVGEARSTETISNEQLSSETVNLYLSGKYEEAIPIIESFFALNKNNGQVAMMLASSYLQTNQAEKAEDLLRRLQVDNNNDFYSEIIDWQLSLSLLKQSKVEEAKKLLREVESEKGYYSEKASTLLKSL